jgi:hypothetical protein
MLQIYNKYGQLKVVSSTSSTGVSSVSAVSPLTSTGGTNPIISTLITPNKLLGRHSVTTGAMQEIIIGSGLSLVGNTLISTSTVTPSALTKVDDTNVTLTLGGTPSTALLQNVSLTLGWTGTLADSRITSASTWNAKQDAISLTTLGTSGPATFISNVLNIPQYTDVFTGTVTSVAALTLGTTGTDLSSTVANPTTTPVITLNVPTASATNRGALSPTDWTTFNNKQNALGYTPPRTWYSGINGITVANTLTITPTYTQLIPAGTFTEGDVIEVAFRSTSPGAKTSASSNYIYINTNNDLIGTPIQVAIFTGSTTTRTIQIQRSLAIKSSTTKVINPASNLSTDTGSTAAMTNLTIDWTIDQYFIFAIGHTVADQTLFGDFFRIIKN